MFVPLGYAAGLVFTQLSERCASTQREVDYWNGKNGTTTRGDRSGQLIALSELGGRAKSNSVLSQASPAPAGLRQRVGRSRPQPGARLPLLR
jgi:hypothetical protein